MILYLHLNHSLANTLFFHRFWHINILICHSVPSTFDSKFLVSTQHFLRLMARHSPSAPASIYSAVHASAVCSPRYVVRMSLVLYACVVASRSPAPTHLAPCQCIPPAAALKIYLTHAGLQCIALFMCLNYHSLALRKCQITMAAICVIGVPSLLGIFPSLPVKSYLGYVGHM